MGNTHRENGGQKQIPNNRDRRPVQKDAGYVFNDAGFGD